MASDRRKILRAIQRESRQIRDPKARKVFRRAAVQTGLVESNLSNPSGGDADSAGWRQERASLYADPTNIKASARRFREEFQQHYTPGEKSYDVAAQVQRPAAQYRGRYKERAGDAEAILRGEVGGAPNRRQGASYETKTTPGVDNAPLRQQAKLSYLQNEHDPDALLNLGLTLRDSQDVPGKTTRTRVKAPKGSGPKGKVSGVGGPLLELFYKDMSIKNGKPASPVPNHDDHVHIAAGKKSVVRLGKLAQEMGLSVRENEAFDPVDPVHTKNSYHYRSQAIDVSGDPKKLKRYAKRVRRIYAR